MINEGYKLKVMEIKCLRSVCVVTRMDRWRIEEVRCRVGVTEKLNDGVDWKV